MIPRAAAAFLLGALLFNRSDAGDLLAEQNARYFEIEGRVLYGWEWGSIGAGRSEGRNHTGNGLDSHSDLGLRHGEFSWAGSLTIQITKSDRVTFRALDVLYKGEIRARREFTYKNDEFPENASIRPQVGVFMAGGAYNRLVASGHDTEFWLGIGLTHSATEAGILSADSPAGGAMANTQAWMLTLDASTRTQLGKGFSFVTHERLAGWGMPWLFNAKQRPILGFELANARFLDIDAALRFQPVHFVSLEIGLEFLWLTQHYNGKQDDGDFGNTRVHLRLLAPFVGLRIAF